MKKADIFLENEINIWSKPQVIAKFGLWFLIVDNILNKVVVAAEKWKTALLSAVLTADRKKNYGKYSNIWNKRVIFDNKWNKNYYKISEPLI